MQASRILLAVLATAALPLAGCDGEGAAQSGNRAAVAPDGPDPVEAQLNALDDVGRRVAFVRAILDANFTCKQVVKDVVKPRDNGRPVWLATCDNGGEYRITLQRGGIFTVSGVREPNRLVFPKATATPEAVKDMLK